MSTEVMSGLFGKVAEQLGEGLLGASAVESRAGELESRGGLDAAELARILGAGAVSSGWAMYQSGLAGQLERVPGVKDEAMGHLIAGEWCDPEGVSVMVRPEPGGRYRWVRWVPGQGQEWLCDERRFRTPAGQAIRYLRLWSEQEDPHGAWRPAFAVFAGFEDSGEQA